MKITIERVNFQTAAQLIAALNKLAGGVVSLDEIYIRDIWGDSLDCVYLSQETLSDKSVVFDAVLLAEGDPDS